MESHSDIARLADLFGAGVTTIDSHTAGEATRLIVAGFGPVAGRTMAEKLASVKADRDHLRALLTREPRGSREIMAALLTPAVSAEARFGLIYMDARRYPYLCGHATIGALVTLAKTGFLTLAEGENRVPVDTPSGLVEAGVSVRDGAVAGVTLTMVPSFVYATGRELEVDGFGRIAVDLVCTGGFFAMVDTAQLRLAPVLENKEILADLGMKIIQAANEQLTVAHPLRPEVGTVDVAEFYDRQPVAGRASGRGMVVYGEAHVDRSPCGTGTAAKLTLLHHRGEIGLQQRYVNYSPLLSSFAATVVRTERIGPLEGVVVQIEGLAHVTGVHRFFLEENDPFPHGFIMA